MAARALVRREASRSGFSPPAPKRLSLLIGSYPEILVALAGLDPSDHPPPPHTHDKQTASRRPTYGGRKPGRDGGAAVPATHPDRGTSNFESSRAHTRWRDQASGTNWSAQVQGKG
ncbi:hypothetical protein ON010_g159 [Phytophthora cinnamomi]|nr:hypothetical protein ON010_g159 [Phytophthora cinnamomi]